MLNNFTGMGRLTADPELKSTQSGTLVTNFTIAIDRDYKSGEEKKTDFLPITAWRQTADFICKWFKKGDLIAIVGSVQTRQYEDNEGKKRTIYEINADKAYFCGGKNNNAENTKSPISTDFESVEQDDGLPF